MDEERGQRLTSFCLNQTAPLKLSVIGKVQLTSAELRSIWAYADEVCVKMDGRNVVRLDRNKREKSLNIRVPALRPVEFSVKGAGSVTIRLTCASGSSVKAEASAPKRVTINRAMLKRKCHPVDFEICGSMYPVHSERKDMSELDLPDVPWPERKKMRFEVAKDFNMNENFNNGNEDGLSDEADDFDDSRSTDLVKDVEFVVAATNIVIQIVNLGDIRVKRDDKQSDPSVWLDRLAVIFRHTVPHVPEGKVHPCQDVIKQVWPVLYKCFQKYGGDERTVERCCRCVRYAVRCLSKKSSALLTPVLSQIIEQYQDHSHSCYLYLGSVLVDEYGLEPTYTSGLLNMLQALSTPTFKMLEEQDGLRNHPDTVDDLFRLTTRFIQTMPVAFLQRPIARSILLCGIAIISIHHRDANESVSKYFLEFIHCAREKAENEDFVTRRMLVVDMLRESGQVHSLLKASLFDLPKPMITNAAEIIYELHLVDSASVGQWLQIELQALPTHSPGGAVNATPQQLADFHATVTSADKVKAVAHALHEFARLYR